MDLGRICGSVDPGFVELDQGIARQATCLEEIPSKPSNTLFFEEEKTRHEMIVSSLLAKMFLLFSIENRFQCAIIHIWSIGFFELTNENSNSVVLALGRTVAIPPQNV